jgi:HAMP domain-containing protein
MKIRRKFTFILAGAFIAAMLAMSCIAYWILYGNAHKEINERARLMLEAASAMRTYTTAHIKPLVATSSADGFHAETVPAFAAMSAFALMRETSPDYTYRETALNPTNLSDRPADWEQAIILHFRDYPAITEISATRSTPAGDSMYIAKPISVDKASCLECHSQPSAAPAALIKTYGSSNGFGWKLHEIVGAQIVAVPTSVSIERARSTFLLFIGLIFIVAVLTLIILDYTLRRLVVTPITSLNELCDSVSTGDFTREVPQIKGDDEISSLTRSFSRMRISLQKAMRMLER